MSMYSDLQSSDGLLYNSIKDRSLKVTPVICMESPRMTVYSAWDTGVIKKCSETGEEFFALM